MIYIIPHQSVRQKNKEKNTITIKNVERTTLSMSRTYRQFTGYYAEQTHSPLNAEGRSDLPFRHPPPQKGDKAELWVTLPRTPPHRALSWASLFSKPEWDVASAHRTLCP